MPIPPSLILIADDNADSASLVRQLLAQAGYRTAMARDGEEALSQVEALQPDLLLLDIVMPKLEGIGVIKQLRERPQYQELPIVVLSAKTEVEERVAGLDAGADEYLTKPIVGAELLARVRAMLRIQETLRARQQLEEENERLRQEVAALEGFGEMVGHSPAMQEVYRLIQKVANGRASVVITGESGTGKEWVARAIHASGPRKEGAFIAVNCGALPENLLEAELFGYRRGSFTGAEADRAGLFEAASGGTLFLDEIGDVPLPMQVRLLRALQEGEITRIGDNHPRPVDVRLIASTHQDLKGLVQAGKFRQDLYFRLNVISIQLPPLRQRREDILPLATHFLQRYCEGLGQVVPALALETRRLLLDYPWPGNVRELEHEMERVVTLSEPNQEITPELLSEDLRGQGIPALVQQGAQGEKLKELVIQLERQLIQETLEKNQGNHTRTTEQLGLSRQGLLKKMHRYGIG